MCSTLYDSPSCVGEVAGVGEGQLEPLEGAVLLDDPGHLGLDHGEVVLGERAGAGVDVVVEARLGRRAEAELRPREEAEDGAAEDVRGRVPQDAEGVGS